MHGDRSSGTRRVASCAVTLAAALVGAGPVVGRPAAAAAPAATYVALGDSFTAGPLIPGQAGAPAGCFRSTRDYPHLLAAAEGVTLADVSCSGAHTDDMAGVQRLRGGSNPPQLRSVGPATRLVTLGIGANDMGFTEVFTKCINLLPLRGSCRNRWAGASGDVISGRIAATAPKVAAVLAEIHRLAPSATVDVVGYPAILPVTGVGCWPVLPFTPVDVPWLRAKEVELNAMLASVAAGGGARYVDTYGPSAGHDACASQWARWVEPIIPPSSAAPVHPNGMGMRAVAWLVGRAVPPLRP
ncbi:MAG: SGNH/GDSL hydrolase family protein [Acidimicrobiales bacterium]